jgi:geranylgeranyl diphosphate synthase type II
MNTMASDEQIVPQLLREYGGMARSALQKYLVFNGARGAEYMTSAVRDYPQRGGRSLRSTICIATARAFGAATEDALNSAVAIEIFHNAFLVHDDIEDMSEQRRGLPTLHATHGVPIAINVGDTLSVLGLRPLLENRMRLGLRVALRILEEAEQMARETVEGQAIELGWRHNNATDLGEDDYLRMVLKKTCWYSTIFPNRVGVLIATRDDSGLDCYVPFGFFIGAAFQIQDDILNLIGDRAAYGKECNGDIWEGKRSMMIVHLLKQTNSHDRERLANLLSKHRSAKRDADVQWVRRLMDGHGSIEFARGVAHGLAGAALNEFSLHFQGLPETRDLAFLRELPRWVLGRS